MGCSLVERQVLFFLGFVTAFTAAVVGCVFYVLVNVFFICKTNCATSVRRATRLPTRIATAFMSRCTKSRSLFGSRATRSGIYSTVLPRDSFSQRLDSSGVLGLGLRATVQLLGTSLFRRSREKSACPSFGRGFVGCSDKCCMCSLRRVLV